MILDSTIAGRKGIVLTCKERLVGFYARLGFVDEGTSASTHGNVVWRQMRLTLAQSPSEETFVESDPDAKTMEIPVVSDFSPFYQNAQEVLLSPVYTFHLLKSVS